MQTSQPTLSAINVSHIDTDMSVRHVESRVPLLLALPVIGATSVGLWLLLYRAGSTLFSLFG